MKKITILIAMLFFTAIGFSQTVIYSEDFESGGADWQDQNLGDGDTSWAFDTMVVAGGGATNDFTTLAATFDDDAAGDDGQHDFRLLWHGPEDVSAYGDITLTYDYALNVLGTDLELLHVSLWDNANATWINITTYGDDTDPTTDSIDVSAAIFANPGIDPVNLYFGFGYDDVDSGWAWGAGIDNVELTGFTGDPDTTFTHIANAANISGNLTVIDHPLLNGNPNAKIVVSHNWQASNFLNVNTEGVWYNGSQWTIFNENSGTSMIDGAAFNVYIDGINSKTITHIANAANEGAIPGYTVIDDVTVNGDPNAIIVFGKYWNPFSVYNPDHYGLYYNGTNWIIFNEDNNATNAIPTDAAFNVVLAPSGSNVQAFKHQATAANTTDYYTILDNALINGNPDAKIVFSHNWGTSGDVSNVIVENTQNLWYDDVSSTWRIFNDITTEDMNVNTLFNIIVNTDPTAAVVNNELVDFIVYPNPVKDILNISTQEEVSKVTVYNLLGQEVKTSIPTSSDINMDISELNAGVYIVKIISNDNEYSKRFIKK